MPKCLECGFEAPRLQWTHFKFKCTGKFENGKQYMEAYPGAKTVDEELAKRTAVTEETMIRKYGAEEGAKRWTVYKQKQAHSNSLEYKQDKHGWSAEEFRVYNLSRAITPETMIKKYGLEDGLKRYDEYCDKQKITKSKEYVVAKYGIERWEEINSKKAKPHDPIYISLKYNMSLEDAVDWLMARNKYIGHSQIEMEFVALLEGIVGPLEHTSIKSPFGKWSKEANSYFVYDVKHENCIIEFNGDYWHANPNQYKADNLIRGKLASSIWYKDALKIKSVVDCGYQVNVVWESDYLKNPMKIVEGVAEWMLNTQK